MAIYKEKYLLPSKGIPYGKQDLELEIRNTTTAEEKLLVGSTTDTIDEVLSACVYFPDGLELSQLISPDKHFLLMKLRVVSFGSDYYVSHKCPFCGKWSEYKIDLDKLPVDYLPDDFVEPYDKFELPVCKAKVELKLPRMYDLDEANDRAKRYHKRFPEAKGDIGYIYRLMANIAKVDGKELTLAPLQEFVESLHSRDSEYIKHRINKLKVGIDTNIFETCPKCREEIEFDLPIGSEFFHTRFDD